MKAISTLLAAVAACVTLVASPGDAAEFGGIRSASIYPFIQYFTWEEFGGNGNRLLKESGPQHGLGGNLKLGLIEGAAGAMTLNWKMEIFGGIDDYDGTTQNDLAHPKTSNRPVRTDVNYFGFSEEIDLGWAIPVRNVTIEPFAGLGYRWWLRNIENAASVDTDGVPFPVSGYTEYWSSLSLLLGVRNQYPVAKDASFSIMGAAKYPFFNRNRVDYPGTGTVELAPGSAWSVVADAGITYRHLSANVFYENFVFLRSSVVHNLYQPRSESEIFGLRVGWAFR